MADIQTQEIKNNDAPDVIWGTGKRKCAIARVWLRQGSGKFTVNGKDVKDHFHREAQTRTAMVPLVITQRENRYDILATVIGGGIAGHADAIMLGLARALEKAEPSLRPVLKSAGCLSRDARVKERKKYGQKGARKKFQFSKR